MSPLLEDSPFSIHPQASFELGGFQVEVLAHEGQFLDVHYFKVNFCPSSSGARDERFGLLRIGSPEGELKRELTIRDGLGDLKMLAALHGIETKDNVVVSAQPSNSLVEPETVDASELSRNGDPDETDPDERNPDERNPDETAPDEGASSDGTSNHDVPDDGDYLEEEFLAPTISGLAESKLFLLSDYPKSETSLANWLEHKQPLETVLLTASQICQFFRYLYQRQWVFVQLLPQYIEVGVPSIFYDLTGVYPVGEKLPRGIEADYCAPELLYQHPIDEKMSTYVVGSLLYEAIHQKPLSRESDSPSDIVTIPRISQIVNLCLAPIIDRFPLEQLLNLLIETRKQLNTPQVQWQTASHSTLGLSASRLQNEDSHGIRQQQSSLDQAFLLAAVADGMGGMTQGEVASRLAIDALMNMPIPEKFQDVSQQEQWLVSLVHKANEVVADSVEDGGTTLSSVLAIDQNLMLAHVGDSRIFLIRNGEIQQMSEDHSMVAMLVASEQITQEESLTHPDRNMLLRSLGSKRTLSEGYVQSMTTSLEHGDIVLLCSDGVWDLVPNAHLLEIFTTHSSLQAAVNTAIEKVLDQGATDNATLLALQCSISAHF